MAISNQEVIKVLENELTCVKRQDTTECIRNQGGSCNDCDLVLPAEMIEDAYNAAISCVKESILTEGDWR